MGKSESYHMQVYMRPEVRERLAALSKKLGLSQSATVVLALERLEEVPYPLPVGRHGVRVPKQVRRLPEAE